MRRSESGENRPCGARFSEASTRDFASSNRTDPHWSALPRSFCQQPICQKEFSRTCRLKGRGLSPRACKNYPARTHPLGNKDAENFHEVGYSGRTGQSRLCTKRREKCEVPALVKAGCREHPAFCAKPPEPDSGVSIHGSSIRRKRSLYQK
jgi:hypothetical protein